MYSRSDGVVVETCIDIVVGEVVNGESVVNKVLCGEEPKELVVQSDVLGVSACGELVVVHSVVVATFEKSVKASTVVSCTVVELGKEQL